MGTQEYSSYNLHIPRKSFTKKINDSFHSNQTKKSQNLNNHQMKALNNLIQRTGIIICNADKVVIIDVNDYINEANRQFGINQ